ncbi:MAG: DUF3306 domain-containing protein [Burkholderiales bacterium]
MTEEKSFLHRWSRRKHEAARAVEPAPAPVAPPAAPAATDALAAPAPAPAPAIAPEPPPLPPVESLTIDSDFAPFLSSKVDETVKRAALRKLFTDPHFNVMDGLDIYIDDYSKPDPMPAGFLDKLADVYKTVEEKADDLARIEAAAVAAEPAPPAEPAPAQVEAPAAQAQSEVEPDDHRG